MFVRGGRLVGFALIMLLAGCGGGSTSAPKTLPPLPTPTVTSAAPSPGPSSLSKQDELAAATHVVREYFELLNAPTTVANAKRLASLMTPSCSCRRVARSTLQVARKGEEYFGRTSVDDLKANYDGEAAADVLVEYHYARSGIRTASGSVVQSSPGRSGATMDIRLRLVNERWLIDALQYLRAGHAS